jgi:hypothetical protein
MKHKTTDKALKQAFRLVSASYCEIQYALTPYRPSAYTCGVNGWKADVYELDYCTVVTGYNVPSHATELPSELCRTIDAEAKAVPHEQRAEILKLHLVKFLGV